MLPMQDALGAWSLTRLSREDTVAIYPGFTGVRSRIARVPNSDHSIHMSTAVLDAS